MRRRPVVMLAVGLVLVALAVLGAVQWRARYVFQTRGWALDFPEPVADTPGAEGATLSRVCVNTSLEAYAAEDLDWALDTIDEGGFDWVRQRISWAAVEPAQGETDWAPVDAIVSGLDGRSVGLFAVLDTAPAWAGSPPDAQAYAQWAGAVAERYGDRVTYYQIWHNPNLGDAWGGTADPYAYTALLAQAAEAIRAADADARIVLGSLAPTVERGERNYTEDLFLEMLYDAGAGPFFDVVAVQPYGFETGPDDRRVAADVLNFSRAILVREALVAHGEGRKAVWAATFGWNSKPDGWPGPDSIWGSVDETTQAAYTVEALERVEREWPWMGLMCVNGLQPRPEAGNEGREDSVTPDAGIPAPDAVEHWGYALVGPAVDGGLGPGAKRPVYAAVREWAARPVAAVTGAYRADTDLAAFEGTWTLGPQGADIGQSGDWVQFTFDGTDVALTVRRGPYRAFLFVTVDGAPAPALPRDRDGRAYVVLYDPLSAVATVPLAEGLAAGQHTVEVVAERGWGQWALADWRVLSRPEVAISPGWGYGVFGAFGLMGFALAVYAAPRVEWGKLGDAVGGLLRRTREWVQVALAAVTTAVTLFAAWQTMMDQGVFRRLGDHGEVAALLLSAGCFYLSPWFVLSLGAGLAMAVMVFLRPALGLALTMLAAPLYLHPLSMFGKSFSLAELVLLPTLAGWALQWAARRRGEGKTRGREDAETRRHEGTRRLLAPVVAFVGIAVIASLTAEHQREAFRELRLVVLEPVLLLLACVSLPMDRRARWRIIDAWVLSGLMVAVVGLVQYLFLGDVITAEGGVQRLRSLYGSPNNVGLYLGRLIPVLLAVAFGGGQAPPEGRGRWAAGARGWLGTLVHDRRRLAYLLALAPLGLALVLSLSRGAIVLGIPAALLVMGWLAGKRWRSVAVVALVLGLVALIPLLRTPRFADMLDPTQGTTGFRVALWYSTLGLVRDHPLLGVGPDNFLYAYRTRYVLPTAWEEFNLSHPHNIVLDFAARLGVPGLAVLIWIQVAFWQGLGELRALRQHSSSWTRALAIGIAGSMADFLAHGLVDASYFVIDLAFVAMLSIAVVIWLRDGWLED